MHAFASRIRSPVPRGGCMGGGGGAPIGVALIGLVAYVDATWAGSQIGPMGNFLVRTTYASLAITYVGRCPVGQ